MRTITITPAQARSLVTKAAKANVTAETSTRQARIVSAQATHAAKETGLLGGDSPTYETGEAFIKAIALRGSNGQYVSKSTLTGLARLGRALAHGLDPEKEGERWNALSSKAGTKEVGAVLGANVETVDMREVRKVADAILADQAKARQEGATRSPNSAGGKSDADTVEQAVAKDPGKVAAQAVQMLALAVQGLDDETFAAVESRLVEIVATETARRADAAAQAATRKTRKPKAA